jgi:hypothetical protein
MVARVAVFDHDNDGCFDNGTAILSLTKESPACWNRLRRNRDRSAQGLSAHNNFTDAHPER